MADIITGVEGFGDINSDRLTTDKRSNFMYKVAKLAPFNAFLQWCPKGPKPQAEIVYWAETTYFPYLVLVKTAVVDTTTTTIDLGTAAGVAGVTVGDVLQNPVTRECMLVSAKSTTTITVIRSIGTTEGVIADEQYLLNLGNVFGEGTGIPESKEQETEWKSNYIQQIKKSWKVTGRADRLGTEEAKGKGALYRQRRAEKVQEFLRELELTFWFGQSGVDSTAADSKRRTFMAGVEQYIRAADSRTYNINGTITTWAEIEAISEQAWDDTDADMLWWFVSPRINSQLNSLAFNKLTDDALNSKKLGCTVKSLETSNGEIKLVRENWFKSDLAGYGFLVDKACFERIESKPQEVHDDTQDDETDARHGYVDWEGSLVVRHPGRMLLTYGCTAA